jgi:hypothetical protein
MPETFDLYNHAYRGHDLDVYRQIRLATYGHDFGQTSWVSTEESGDIPRFLNISALFDKKDAAGTAGILFPVK